MASDPASNILCASRRRSDHSNNSTKRTGGSMSNLMSEKWGEEIKKLLKELESEG